MFFSGARPAQEMGAEDVKLFLSDLAAGSPCFLITLTGHLGGIVSSVETP